MSYRLKLKVLSMQSAIRALDLVHRLDVGLLAMETAREDTGFLAHFTYEAPGDEAARHIAVRIGAIVGVVTAELAAPEAPAVGLFASGAASDRCAQPAAPKALEHFAIG